jgi:hypothetical protein
VDVHNGSCLDPFGELVDCYGEVREAPGRLSERPTMLRCHKTKGYVVGIV